MDYPQPGFITPDLSTVLGLSGRIGEFFIEVFTLENPPVAWGVQIRSLPFVFLLTIFIVLFIMAVWVRLPPFPFGGLADPLPVSLNLLDVLTRVLRCYS